MRTILWILASIVIIGAIIILVGPLLISTAAVRDKAFAKVEAATGYRLRVSGPVRISVFPSLDLVADDVGIAQTASGDTTEFATARRLRLGLVLRPLLSGKVQMTEMTLIDPVIALPESSNAKSGEVGADGQGDAAARPLNNLNLDKLVIKNGTVILPGLKDMPGKRIEALTLDASLPAPSGPLSFDLKARYEGEPVHIAGSIGSFGHFLKGGTAPVKLAVEAPAYLPAETTVAGNVTYKDDALWISQLAAKSGANIVSGNITYQGDALTLNLQAGYEGEPVHIAGSIGSFGQFLDGGAASIELVIGAPAYLPAEATVAGTAAYNDDTLALTEFTAESGGNTLAGTATYSEKDDIVTLDMQAEYEGQPVHVAGSIGSFGHFLDGGAAPIRLAIDAPAYLRARAVLAGSASYKDGTLALTEFTADSAGYALSGNGTYKDDTLTLNPITVQTDGQTVTGALTANLAGDVPSIGASLSAQMLDLNRLLSNAGGVPSSGGGDGAETVPEVGAGEGAPGWNDAKIDFSPLKAINANLELAVGQLVYRSIKISSATIEATLSGGKLAAEIPSLKLYNGEGTATLNIDVSGEVPTHRVRLSLANLDAYPFLDDAAEFQSIEGKGTIAVDLAASGDSRRAMVPALNGTAKFEFTGGAIRGLNVAKMLRNLTTGILTGWQYNEEAKTDFTNLRASFKLANGDAQTDDLRLIGPLVSMGGGGTVNLPGQMLKLRVNPLMLASVEGEGGKNRLLGFPVPVAISGPWAKPLIYPDIVGILDHPVAAYEQLNKLGGGLIAVPANLVGIDIGGRGLVETGIAIPGALTKGAINGVGAILGKKKPDDAAPAENTAQEAPIVDGGAAEPTSAQAGAKPEPAAVPAPMGRDAPSTNPLAQGSFVGTKQQEVGTQQPADAASSTENDTQQAPVADGGAGEAEKPKKPSAAQAGAKPKPAPASAPSTTPSADPLMQGMFVGTKQQEVGTKQQEVGTQQPADAASSAENDTQQAPVADGGAGEAEKPKDQPAAQADARPEPAPTRAPSATPSANPLMQGTFGN